MDVAALAAANALVGNRLDAAGIEFAYAGGTWSVEGGPVRVAIAGDGVAGQIDGGPPASLRSMLLWPGQKLSIVASGKTVWGYIGVEGGIDVPADLGSRSTLARFKLGGFLGRALQAGDVLPLGPSPDSKTARPRAEKMLRPDAQPKCASADEPIRVVLGPQDDMFTSKGLATLLGETFTVSRRIDRMAYQLDGPPIEHRDGFNIVSDATQVGSIQVPGTRLPIVLMRDCQPTGGYPKIATVITVDLGRFGQIPPGRPVRFRAVGVEAAQVLRAEFMAQLRALPDRVQDVTGRFARRRQHWLV